MMTTRPPSLSSPSSPSLSQAPLPPSPHTPPSIPSAPSQAWLMCVPWKRRNPHLSLSSRSSRQDVWVLSSDSSSAPGGKRNQTNKPGGRQKRVLGGGKEDWGWRWERWLVGLGQGSPGASGESGSVTETVGVTYANKIKCNYMARTPLFCIKASLWAAVPPLKWQEMLDVLVIYSQRSACWKNALWDLFSRHKGEKRLPNPI